MKKTVVAIFSFAFLFLAMGVMAQEKRESKLDKPVKAKNVEISKKKVITEGEKKALDKVESIIKGKPVKPVPIPDLTIGGAIGVLGAALPSGGQRYAILVGLANYPGIDNDLCVAAAKTGKDFPTAVDGLAEYCKDQDALNMKKALIETYNYVDDEQHIFVFSDAKAKFDAIKSKIDELVVGTNGNPPILKAEDELVFFFSGHSSTGIVADEAGLNDESPDEAMFIYDQNYSEITFAADGKEQVPSDASFIWDDQLKEWFAGSPTKRILFAFDTCNAGGMNDLQSDGRVLAMSSTEYQSSMTYYLGGYNNGTPENPIYKESEGLFAHYFVRRAMVDGLGDGYNPLNRKNVLKYDGNVAVEEAFNYAYPIVKAIQIPVLNDKFFNDLLLGY